MLALFAAKNLILDHDTYSNHHANGEQDQQVFGVQGTMQHIGRVMARVCIYSWGKQAR